MPSGTPSNGFPVSVVSKSNAPTCARAGDRDPETTETSPQPVRPQPVRRPGDVRAGEQVSALQLLTAEQVAERWQVPKAHVYRLARDGRVPVVELGRWYRWRLADLEAFEAAGGTAANV